MKRFFVILALIFFASASLADGIKMIGRDFWVDDEDIKPLSFGLCSWTDKDSDCQPGIYFNCSLFNFWDNNLRLGVGFAASFPDPDNNISVVDLSLTMPTVTTLLFDHLELGFYASPFYNIPKYSDNPWGFMIGYAFWF